MHGTSSLSSWSPGGTTSLSDVATQTVKIADAPPDLQAAVLATVVAILSHRRQFLPCEG